MTIFSIFALTVALLLLAITPGPGVFATIALALTGHRRSVLALIVGIVIGDLIYMTVAVFGLATMARELGDLFIIVKICGGAYLIWLGVKIWHSEPQCLDNSIKKDPRPYSRNLISGLLITLSNPKVILFYCGFLPTFVDLSILTWIDYVMITVTVGVVIGSVLITYAYLAGRIGRILSNAPAARGLNRIAAGVMATTGIAIVVE